MKNQLLQDSYLNELVKEKSELEVCLNQIEQEQQDVVVELKRENIKTLGKRDE